MPTDCMYTMGKQLSTFLDSKRLCRQFQEKILKKFLSAPSKRVLEGVLLAPYQAAETDEIVLKRHFVFGLEISAIECRVVGAEAEVDSSFIQPTRHFTHRGEVWEGAGLQVGARTEFETDATLA